MTETSNETQKVSETAESSLHLTLPVYHFFEAQPKFQGRVLALFRGLEAQGVEAFDEDPDTGILSTMAMEQDESGGYMVRALKLEGTLMILAVSPFTKELYDQGNDGGTLGGPELEFALRQLTETRRKAVMGLMTELPGMQIDAKWPQVAPGVFFAEVEPDRGPEADDDADPAYLDKGLMILFCKKQQGLQLIGMVPTVWTTAQLLSKFDKSNSNEHLFDERK